MNQILSRAIRSRVPRRVRNWLKSPRQSCRWLQEELRYWAGACPTIQFGADWTLKCHPTAYRFIRENQVCDPAQKKELDGFINSLVPGSILFDIGAHFGVFSLAVLRFGGKDARVIAVDPSPTSVRLLAIQSQLNDVASDRLQIIQASVGEHAGEQNMVSVGVIGGGYFVVPEKTHSAIDFTKTMSTTVDNLVTTTRRRPTHLKIDVEGAEEAVLRGAMNTLTAPQAPILFLELHNAFIRRRGGEPGKVLGLLEDFGYIIRHASPDAVTCESLLTPDVIRLMAAKGIEQGPPPFASKD
jgi:FkbM family methyltransferase